MPSILTHTLGLHSDTRPGSAEAMGDYLCTEVTGECPKPKLGGLPADLDLSQFSPEVAAALKAQLGQG